MRCGESGSRDGHGFREEADDDWLLFFALRGLAPPPNLYTPKMESRGRQNSWAHGEGRKEGRRQESLSRHDVE